jgi:hypothetical protein
MSSYREFFLHLSDQPKTREQLMQETGLDAKVVSNRLTQCRVHGLAKRTKQGWLARGVAADGETSAVDPKRPARKPRKAGKKRGAAKRRGRAATTPAAAAGSDELTLDYYIDIDGDVQIVRRDGEGEAAFIPCADARRLARFLERFRPMLEAAA